METRVPYGFKKGDGSTMTIEVVDANGNTRDEVYLLAKYGPYQIYRPVVPEGTKVWRIVRLVERVDTNSSIQVTMSDKYGNRPLTRVAWYWPDAPIDIWAGPADGLVTGMVPGRAVELVTKNDGTVTGDMGRGAYYDPAKGERGPHGMWAYGHETHSDVIRGLGMIVGTNHDHFDVEFEEVEALAEETDPVPDPDFQLKVLRKLNKIIALLTAIEENTA